MDDKNNYIQTKNGILKVTDIQALEQAQPKPPKKSLILDEKKTPGIYDTDTFNQAEKMV
jgi:hypothetical protein